MTLPKNILAKDLLPYNDDKSGTEYLQTSNVIRKSLKPNGKKSLVCVLFRLCAKLQVFTIHNGKINILNIFTFPKLITLQAFILFLRFQISTTTLKIKLSYHIFKQTINKDS